MAKKIIQAQMQQRRDTKANWAAQNPVLLAGELGIVSDDPNLYKVGDGTTAWNALPFRGFNGTIVQETGTSEDTVMSQKAVTEELAKLSETTDSKVQEVSSRIADIVPFDGGFVITDAKGNITFKIDNNGIEASSSSYTIIEDGRDSIIVCDGRGYVYAKVSDSLIEQIQNAKVKALGKAALSWIDDDFGAINGQDEVVASYKKVHDRCIEIGMRLDFAAPVLKGSFEMLAQSWEEEGFRFLMHPSHQGWFNEPSSGYYYDFAVARASLIQTIRYHKKRLISDGHILVYPGASAGEKEIRDLAKQYCECAIAATYEGCNKGLSYSQYNLQRISIEPSADRTKTSIKNKIRQYIEDGAWVILYTHIGGIDNLVTIDETTVSIPNVMEIAEYAHSLCPMRSTAEIWRERKPMYNL